jgi:hypothetical protein
LQIGTKDPPLRGMNAMEKRTISLRLLAGLLSSAIAACSGAGQGDLVTVGVRPTDGSAAMGGIGAGGAGGLPTPGIDVMNQIPEDNSGTGRGDAAAGASSAGTSATAGSGVTGEAGGASAAAGTSSAGAGVAGMGVAGAGGSLGPNQDECGAIPSQPAGNVTSGRVSGSGLIGYDVTAPNVYTALRTTLAVPAKPAPNGQIFIWPGLQPTPSAMNLQSIGNGALLPVLAWGPSCAPDAPSGYSTWWIAPMYSNISSSDSQYAGCHAGKVVLAETKQLLDIEIHVEGTKWIQKVVNRDTLESSYFSMDLRGQAQGRAFFDIELPTSNKPTEDIVFTNTVLSMDMSDPDACQPVMRGSNDFASKPRVSADGKHCCIDRIVLRASRVMATTMDPP